MLCSCSHFFEIWTNIKLGDQTSYVGTVAIPCLLFIYNNFLIDIVKNELSQKVFLKSLINIKDFKKEGWKNLLLTYAKQMASPSCKKWLRQRMNHRETKPDFTSLKTKLGRFFMIIVVTLSFCSVKTAWWKLTTNKNPKQLAQ